MNPEKQRLIHDLMNDAGEDARRAETLLAGGRLLRRRRHARQATRGLVFLGVAVLAALCVQQWTARKSSVVADAPNDLPVTVTDVPRLSDDELLALFPDVPVGLATLSDGRKKLIFPRPGDEARFIRHL